MRLKEYHVAVELFTKWFGRGHTVEGWRVLAGGWPQGAIILDVRLSADGRDVAFTVASDEFDSVAEGQSPPRSAVECESLSRK